MAYSEEEVEEVGERQRGQAKEGQQDCDGCQALPCELSQAKHLEAQHNACTSAQTDTSTACQFHEQQQVETRPLQSAAQNHQQQHTQEWLARLVLHMLDVLQCTVMHQWPKKHTAMMDMVSPSKDRESSKSQ